MFSILSRVYKIYSSKERSYNFERMIIKVFPGVFHPGFFFSTKFLISHLKKYELKSKNILELGAGSGMISVFCAKNFANVTASDISKTAIDNIIANAKLNNCNIAAIHSDLFDSIPKQTFHFIIINPPYFPKDTSTESELAWFCGSDFQYFEKLFKQLPDYLFPETIVLMVLSEDCNIKTIETIAKKNSIEMKLKERRKFFGEENFIFQLHLTTN
ncbi:MAG: class I SAM-dependent methyltransferase [Ignavibacterium sp.]|nr:class I SAM-dependent methyltransferase [Ignavibacterium sp.]